MAERPLIVVLLRLPVQGLSLLKRTLEQALGCVLLYYLSALYVALETLTIRSTASAMLLSGVVRAAVIAAFLGVVTACGYELLWVLLPEHIPLWISLCTVALILIFTTSLAARGLYRKTLRDCGPLISLTMKDIVSFALTAVKYKQILVVSVIGCGRLYLMQKSVQDYQRNAIRAIGLSLVDFVCLVLAAPITILPWRLIQRFSDLLENHALSRISFIAFLWVETIADILSTLPLALVVITFYRIQSFRTVFKLKG